MTESRTTAYRILSLDGGGIRGVFPAAFLARIEEHLEHPIGRYFDLIAGTSTGGIIAIGLGLGLSAGDILKLYVEQGPAIFGQEHGPVQNWIRQKLRGMAHLVVTKHSSEPLRRALEDVLGRRKLGQSRTRLVIPAWHPVLERVYIYKTAHHPRLESDYKQPAIDAAMATAAAPTFLKPHMTEFGGGARRRRRVGQQSDRCRRDRGDRHTRMARRQTQNPFHRHDQRTRQAAAARGASCRWQRRSRGCSWRARHTVRSAPPRSSPATSTSARRSGASIRQRRKADTPWTTPGRISEMRDRAFAEAREQLPELRREFFHSLTDKFVPFHSVQDAAMAENGRVEMANRDA